MSETSIHSVTCPMCNEFAESREVLSIHLHEHLKYFKYACTCGQTFVSESKRDQHCLSTRHCHAYEKIYNQYNEMLLSQLIKDAEHMTAYDVETIVINRAKANLDFDTYMKSAPESSKCVKRQASARSVSRSPERRRISESATYRPLAASNSSAIISPHQINNDASAKGAELRKKQQESIAKRMSQLAPDTFTVMNQPSSSNRSAKSLQTGLIYLDLSKTTMLVAKALMVAQERCKTCKVLVDSSYVMRKEHVSRLHMDRNHSEVDFVELLEDAMKAAFPGLTFSDRQCQLCSETAKSTDIRRKHVVNNHFKEVHIRCPIPGCDTHSSLVMMTSHLKSDHRLPRAHGSIEDKVIKDKYMIDYAEYNRKVNSTLDLAFPCPIPSDVPTAFENRRPVARPVERSSLQTVSTMLVGLSEGARTRSFQADPPQQKQRAASPSSDSSDSDSDSASSPVTRTNPRHNGTMVAKKSPVVTAKQTPVQKSNIILKPIVPVETNAISASSPRSEDSEESASSRPVGCSTANTTYKANNASKTPHIAVITPSPSEKPSYTKVKPEPRTPAKQSPVKVVRNAALSDTSDSDVDNEVRHVGTFKQKRTLAERNRDAAVKKAKEENDDGDESFPSHGSDRASSVDEITIDEKPEKANIDVKDFPRAEVPAANSSTPVTPSSRKRPSDAVHVYTPDNGSKRIMVTTPSKVVRSSVPRTPSGSAHRNRKFPSKRWTSQDRSGGSHTQHFTMPKKPVTGQKPAGAPKNTQLSGWRSRPNYTKN